MDEKDPKKEGMARGSQSSNLTSPVTAPQRRQPREGATTVRVRTRGVATFRRAGIDFGPDPQDVDPASLTHEQLVELLNTDALIAEEIGGTPAATAKGSPPPPAPPRKPEKLEK